MPRSFYCEAKVHLITNHAVISKNNIRLNNRIDVSLPVFPALKRQGGRVGSRWIKYAVSLPFTTLQSTYLNRRKPKKMRSQLSLEHSDAFVARFFLLCPTQSAHWKPVPNLVRFVIVMTVSSLAIKALHKRRSPAETYMLL